MRISKYFYFSIEGDDFNPSVLKEELDLPCEIFFKGEKEVDPIIPEKPIIFKTNRLCYTAILDGQKSIKVFLKQQLEIIVKHLDVLDKYINKYDAYIQLHIWAGNKTGMTLTKQHIQLLNKIGVEMDIEFC